jgi:tRNA pseudouridine55 synthase
VQGQARATKRSEPLHGVLVIDKPRGPTSHDVVAKLRRALGTREIGHAGTLDPMATGVLVIAVGEATKLAPYLTAADKAYEATIALGIETDTLDAEGRETRRADVPISMREALEKVRPGQVHAHVARAIEAERARAMQVPPVFSAIKKDGERSYDRARRGDAPELAPRPVSVLAMELLDGGVDAGVPWLALSLDVAKGYYVRALARDLAAALGTVGHLTALRRTRSGPFTLDEAMPLDTPADELEARLITLERAATRSLPGARLSDAGARDASFGRPVRIDDLGTSAPGPHAWLAPGGRLVAVGAIAEDGAGHVLRGFGRGVTS